MRLWIWLLLRWLRRDTPSVNMVCKWSAAHHIQPPATVYFDKVKDSKLSRAGDPFGCTRSPVFFGTPSPPTLEDEHYMLTNDQRLPPRIWPRPGPDSPWLDIYPIWIVKPTPEVLYRGTYSSLLSGLQPCEYPRRVLARANIVEVMNEKNPDPDTYLR